MAEMASEHQIKVSELVLTIVMVLGGFLSLVGVQ